ncbi:phosphatase [Bacillus subtilis]|nr:phosphatase [Bacillus cereus]POO73794.1 phosphatase [Bacillus subtilis]
MKISRLLLAVVILSSVFTFTHLHGENISSQLKIASDRVTA